MVLKLRKLDFDVGKFFIALLLSFVLVQGISWLLSELDIMPMLKMGWVLLLFLIVIGFTSLFVLGRRLGQLDLKKDLLFILLVFGAIIALFIFLPKMIPQIFSTSGIEIGEYLKQIINAIMRLSPGGIVPR